MGCCGCSNKCSAVTAGIFGLIQGLIGLIFNSYFLNLYTTYRHEISLENVDERLFLLYATDNAITVIIILLIIALSLNVIWIISSTILLIGNSVQNACMVRQWVILTAFYIIGDILLPVIVVIVTLSSFSDVVQSSSLKLQSSINRDGSIEKVVNNTVSSVSLDLYQYYIVLLLSFIKLGPITIIINICLNVFTNRRATEINNPRGYVMMQSPVVIIQNHTIPPQAQFPGAHSPVYPYNPSGIHLQSASSFSPVGDFNHHQHEFINTKPTLSLVDLESNPNC